jgi:hypothetical protein
MYCCIMHAQDALTEAQLSTLEVVMACPTHCGAMLLGRKIERHRAEKAKSDEQCWRYQDAIHGEAVSWKGSRCCKLYRIPPGLCLGGMRVSGLGAMWYSDEQALLYNHE